MRVPPFQLFYRYLRYIALLLCGCIIGSAVFMVLFQHNMEELIQMNEVLKTEKKKLLIQIDGLEKYKDKEALIRSTQIWIEQSANEEPLPESVKGELIERVSNDLQFLIGEPILKIIPNSHNAPQTMKHLYHKIHTNVQDKDYIVTISTVIIVYGEMRIWIKAQEYNSTTT
ncbi:hypothetical protein [Marinicrinis lubricantis]|uniref:Sporulation membrane protein YtrI C-terminal domain-containing protein n=1 Tax=Marinicrinis lubricantis TaxID=2086470 RepID=A0ABW1IJ33_9BACL